MKRNDDKIASLVRQYGATEITGKFEDELVDLIVTQDKFKLKVKENSPRSWLAVVIITIAILSNVGFLVYFNPFSLNPAFFIPITGFIAGLWALIGIYQKHLTAKIGAV